MFAMPDSEKPKEAQKKDKAGTALGIHETLMIIPLSLKDMAAATDRPLKSKD